ncbi:hypothetical protein JRA82_005758 [Raoultella ornithinolytica]|nr:hypothetical protein [Raoultella ornithinolytica]HEC2572729.1 hypothetical protein [Raoultella ornithinolytica]HEQ3490345.1 hypothetical protein [Raoultella ornithinolytica]
MNRRNFLSNLFILSVAHFLFEKKAYAATILDNNYYWYTARNLADDLFWQSLCDKNSIVRRFNQGLNANNRVMLDSTEEEKLGKVSINRKLIEIFSVNTDTTVLIPKGHYLVTDEIIFHLAVSLTIICEPGTIFKLAENVRKNIFVFIGNKINNFSWIGGEIDGNWARQGLEEIKNNKIDDLSHGIIISMFNIAKIESLYVHDCMGHHINHGGNNVFKVRDITIRSHPSNVYPLGGARGDGITGCSRFVDIQNVRGYSTDDLIAVFSGANWIKGIGDESDRQVDSIIIKKIEAFSVYDKSRDFIFYTWHACTIGNINGGSIKTVNITDVNGTCQENTIRIISGLGREYWGKFGQVTISRIKSFINGRSDGSWTDKMSCSHIVIGRSNPNHISVSVEQYIHKLFIAEVQMIGSMGSITGVSLGNILVRQAIIKNIQINYTDDKQYMAAISLVGDDPVSVVSIIDVKQHYSNKKNVDSLRVIFQSHYTGVENINCEFKNISSKSYLDIKIPNVLYFDKNNKINFSGDHFKLR